MGKYYHQIILMIFGFRGVKQLNRSSAAFTQSMNALRSISSSLQSRSNFLARMASTRIAAVCDLFEILSSNDEKYEDKTNFKQIQVRDKAIEWCQTNNIPEPNESVDHLLAHALDLPYESGYRHIQQLSNPSSEALTMSKVQLEHFQDLLRRRATHEPLQYLIGQWDFLDLTLKIQKPLLCPRPETEELVLLVEEELRSQQQHCRVLDVGCGTGAIGIALAQHILKLDVTAIDIEPIAIQVSNQNAQCILGPENRNYKACLSSAADFVHSDSALFDCVVSNPPYIPKGHMQTLDKTVVEFEAWQALCGGEDDAGLQVINEILEKLPIWLKPGGSCWMEVDPSHPEELKKRQDPASAIQLQSVHQDMSGRDRFVKFLKVK